MIFIKRPDGLNSEEMRSIADESNVPFNPQSIIYIPDGRGWIGYKDAPALPDPTLDNVDSVFEERLGFEVEFATGEIQDKLHEWVEASPDDREQLREQGYPP